MRGDSQNGIDRDLENPWRLPGVAQDWRMESGLLFFLLIYHPMMLYCWMLAALMEGLAPWGMIRSLGYLVGIPKIGKDGVST